MPGKSRFEEILLGLQDHPIVIGLLLFLLFVGGLARFKKNMKTIIEPVAKVAKLLVAPLTINNTLNPLKGHPILEDNGSSLLSGGFSVRLNLSHDKSSSHSIIVNEIKPIVKKISEIDKNTHNYQIDGSKSPPQGIVIPDRFLITIKDDVVGNICWGGNPDNKYIPATTDNLLATDPPKEIELSTKEDVKSLEGIVGVYSQGIYEVKFKFQYTVKGKRIDYSTEPVKIISI
jgi:hypothetical protein